MGKCDEFKSELASSVNTYFNNQKNGRFATPTAWIKAIFLLMIFFVLYSIILFGKEPLVLKYFIVLTWGLVSLLIVFNIGHDAVHGSFSKHKWINIILSFSFNLVGANAYSWRLKHNYAHHQNTNIRGKDHDIDIDPFLRVSPHLPYRWYYRWQHYYWPIVYMLFSLLIIFIADVLIFYQERKNNSRFLQPTSEWIILVLTKIFYLFYVFFVPVFLAGFLWSDVLIAFFSYHFFNGLLIGLVFQPSHYFKESKYYNCDENENISWEQLQLNSTVDIAPENKFLSFILGSLNANVSHHLYPKISHVHYPYLSNIVKEVCNKYQLTYYRKSYLDAIKSHIELLKKFSIPN